MVRMPSDRRLKAAAACVVAAAAVGAGLVATRHRPAVREAAPIALHAAFPAAGAAAAGAGASRAAAVAVVSGAGAASAPAALAPDKVTASPTTTSGSGGLGDAVVRRVEQNAQVTVRVKDVAQAFDAATALAGTLGGYVESSNLNAGGSGGAAYATLVLAVPQAQFAACLKQVGALGTTADTSISGQDVTQQYVDLQGRIDALTAERQSYLTLLGKATAIGDILQIQNALTDVQSQIENLTGQLRVLDDLSAMARIAVTLTAPVAAPPAPHVPVALQRIGAALQASAGALADGATALAEAVAWILPWAALGSVAWLVYRRIASGPRA